MQISFERRINARPDTVFSFFTEQEKYARWMGIAASLDPVPGGQFQVTNRDGSITRGEFLEIDPPKRLVFTWGFDGNPDVPPGSTIVTVTLRSEGDQTILQLVHSGLPSEHWAMMHETGWAKYLDRLGIAGSGGDPGADL